MCGCVAVQLWLASYSLQSPGWSLTGSYTPVSAFGQISCVGLSVCLPTLSLCLCLFCCLQKTTCPLRLFKYTFLCHIFQVFFFNFFFCLLILSIDSLLSGSGVHQDIGGTLVGQNEGTSVKGFTRHSNSARGQNYLLE